MPYTLVGNCVVYADTGEPVDGGCHDTHEQALAHLAALNASVPDAKRWTPQADYPTFRGDPIKSLGKNRSGGYLVCFTDDAKRDLTREWFDAETNFMLGVYPILGVPTLYQHGLDDSVGSIPVGRIVHVDISSKGIYVEQEKNFLANCKAYFTALRQPADWLEEQMDYAADYDKMLDEMERNGELGWSSGAHPPSVRVAPNGHIDQWAIWEATNTLTPAMPYETRILPVKSHLSHMQPLSARLSGQTRIDRKDGASNAVRGTGARAGTEGHDSVQNRSTTPTHSWTSETKTTMKLDELKKVVADHAANFAEELTKALMDSEDAALGEEENAGELAEELTQAAMAAAPEDMLEDESVPEAKSIVDLITAAAPQVLAARSAAREERRITLKSMARSAMQQGRASVGAHQPGKSKVGAYSPDTPRGDDKNNARPFNINRNEYSWAKAVLGQMRGHSHYEGHGIKAQNPYNGTLGGYVVNQTLSEQILEPLRPQVIAFKLGVRQVTAPGTGAFIVPKMTTAPGAFRPGINTAINDDNAKFDTVTAYPRPIAAEVIIPRQLLETSLPQAEDMIRDQMIKSIRLQIDKEIFIGTGNVVAPNTGNEIRGILQVAPAANQVTLATNGRSPQYSDLIAAETQLAVQNIEFNESMGFAMNPVTRGTFRTLTDTTGNPLLRSDYSDKAWETMIGYPVEVSTQIPTNVTTGSNSNTSYIFFGRFDYGQYIMTNDIQILVDEVTLMDKLQVRIIAYTFSDFICDYPEAFYVMSGVTR